MTRAKHILLILFVLLSWHPTFADGDEQHGPSDFAVKCVLFFKKLILPHIVPHPSGKWLDAQDITLDGTPIPVKVKVGKRLGFGMKGAVYEIDDIKGHPGIPDYSALGHKLVVKVSHVGRRTGIFFEKFQKILVEEEQAFH